MRVLLFILALLIAAPCQAQSTPAKVEQYNRGTTKMKVGALLMGAGLFLVVTTPGAERVAVPVAVGTGMGLVLWGSRERSSATKPHTVFGLSVGRSNHVSMSRRW